ncbi:HNH endonuclease [Alteromonadaceae bacterium 2753L.S.0a.02]|nr:HNH endonuclease [Alteromonadaceae bacterium 2753L.S.0a.02]
MDETLIVNCIFCCHDTTTECSVEHIIPHSFGCTVTLPRGTVCDKCNQYLSKIDKELIQYGFSAVIRPMLLRHTKKKKPPKFEIGGLVIEGVKGGNCIVRYKDDNKIPALDTENKQLVFELEDTYCDLQKVSRALHKIAYEWMVYKKPDVDLTPFVAMRDYIRRPKPNDFRFFGQKSIKMVDDEPFHIHSLNAANIPCLRVSIYDVEYVVSIEDAFPTDDLEVQGYSIARCINDQERGRTLTFFINDRPHGFLLGSLQ